MQTATPTPDLDLEREANLIIAGACIGAINNLILSREYFFAEGDHETARAYADAIEYMRFIASRIVNNQE